MIGKIVAKINKKLVYYRAKLAHKEIVHFLHIGKTGGTYIKDILEENRAKFKDVHLVLHAHNFTLDKVPQGEKFFFVLRNPISRFISGFYSRKRQGRPKYNNPWTEAEQIAFKQFETPNDLAEALSSNDQEIKNSAIAAMKAINHVNTSFLDWFISIDYFQSRINDLYFVGLQETLDNDLMIIIQKLGAVSWKDNSKALIKENQKHANPKHIDTSMSEQSIINLNSWYIDDFAFFDAIKQSYR